MRVIHGNFRNKGGRPRYGDWGRDAALWLGRHRGRYTLGQLGELAGGMDYAAVGKAVSHFGRRLEKESDLHQTVSPAGASFVKY